MDLGISREERLDMLGFMGRESAGSNMDLFTAPLCDDQIGQTSRKLLLMWQAVVSVLSSPVWMLSAAYN
ncbi:MAG: hypothetical protein JO189_31920 [Deltaproteobacteria bacterium]|nr:hypothetical protein [Deltaproteobacteria bacterium]